MAILRFHKDLSRKQLMASILLFFVHFVILIAIMAGLLLWKEWDHLAVHMKQFGASYLYALFCVLLLIVIMYLYFLFEERKILSTGKNIALMFTILDISFIISWTSPLYKSHTSPLLLHRFIQVLQVFSIG